MERIKTMRNVEIRQLLSKDRQQEVFDMVERDTIRDQILSAFFFDKLQAYREHPETHPYTIKFLQREHAASSRNARMNLFQLIGDGEPEDEVELFG